MENTVLSLNTSLGHLNLITTAQKTVLNSRITYIENMALSIAASLGHLNQITNYSSSCIAT